ncbi:hypothetical protein ABH899_000479 [Paenibacillus sp. RC84]
MKCSIPGCMRLGRLRFAQAPVREPCQKKMQAEAEEYYRVNFKNTSNGIGRPLYKSIYSRTIRERRGHAIRGN